jgi:hypothetical protein
MLDECVINHIIDVQFESPRHGCLSFTWEINKMRHNFIYFWFLAQSFYWYFIAVIGFNRFFLDISASWFALISHSYLLEGEETIIELIADEDWWIERYGHVQKLKGSEWQQFKYQTLWQFFRYLDSECSVGSCGRFDCSRNVWFWIDMFEDNVLTKTDFLLHVTEWEGNYF